MSAAATTESDPDRSVVARGLPALVGGRAAGNLLIRFPYVFLTAMARGLGVSVESATAILGIRELGGLATPVVGRIADRGHERRVIVTTCGLAGIVTIVAPFLVDDVAGRTAGLIAFSALLVAGAVFKFGCDAAQGAWIGHRVPFARRGRILGVMEVAWAGAFLLGVPLCALAVDRWGWRAPFVLTGTILLAFAVAQRLVLPRDRHEQGTPERFSFHIPPGLRGVIGYCCLQPFAQMLVFAVAGDWFVESLGMSLTGLGLNTVLIGCAELAGTGLAAGLTDRIGKRRGASIGLAVGLPAAAGLGLAGDNAVLGVVLLLWFAVGIEFSFVSALPLITELGTTSRASAIGLAMAVLTLARAFSSSIAGVVYTRGGIALTGLLAAAALALGVAVLHWFVREPERPASFVAV
ncbi:MAG TPA: MFS transporter [Microthrixaceae bacterium]|nr:MFS transporter [Microthrixaceae bacterium]